MAGVLWYVVFLLSTTCHETAHAWAAKLGGDLTAFHGGQVSLDPIPHIRREPFGMVIFPLADLCHGRLDDGLGQRAVRSSLVAALSAPGCLDVAGGPGREFLARHCRRNPDPHRHVDRILPLPGIGRLHARGGTGGRGHRVRSGDFREHVVLPQPAVGHVQSDPGAAARWLRRSRPAGLRRHGAPHSEFRPFAGRLQHHRPAAGVAGVRSHLPADFLVRHARALSRARDTPVDLPTA